MRLKIAKFSWGGTDFQTSQMCLEETALVRLHLAMLRIFWISNNILIIIVQYIYLLLGEALISRWMYSKIALYSLFRQPGFCLIFILSKSCSVWSLTENINFISFHGRILSRYSEINKFKTSKDITFLK